MATQGGIRLKLEPDTRLPVIVNGSSDCWDGLEEGALKCLSTWRPWSLRSGIISEFFSFLLPF